MVISRDGGESGLCRKCSRSGQRAVSLLAVALGLGAAVCTAKAPFSLADYFRVSKVSELALTEDGERVAYATTVQSLAENRSVRRVFVQETDGLSPAKELPELASATQLTWLSGTRRIAYKAADARVTQVYAYDTRDGTVAKLTHGADSVVHYRPSPDGRAIAYSTGPVSRPTSARIGAGQEGTKVDVETTGYIDLVAGLYSGSDYPVAESLWIQSLEGEPRSIRVPGQVQSFTWSSDSRQISIVYVRSDIPPSVFRSYYTSIGIVDVGTGQFSELAAARTPVSGGKGVFYWGGEWVPGRPAIVVLRATEANAWIGDLSYPSLSIADIRRPLEQSQLDWVAAELYPRSTQISPTNHAIFIETHLRARDTLLTMQHGVIRRGPVTLPGSNSKFQFSKDFRRIAFVNESLDDAPEVYVQHGREAPRKLSALNAELAGRQLPSYREVSWQAEDGQPISGWLLEPDAKKFRQPWPLLTYIHGGPAYAYPDQFAPSFDNWPYPLEVLASKGIAVFVPQYRGTFSFGWVHGHPTKTDREPVTDVRAGIERLIKQGMADPDALGIAGHSHGAWLGPLIAAQWKVFRAGSFAEGFGSKIVVHESIDRSFNREIHERAIGEPSLYDDPMRYVELSPNFQFKGLATPLLLEAGAEGGPIYMLGMAKAAMHFEVPNEFFVYPQTGHTVTIPRMQLEAAERNLDWFMFWLRADEDTDGRKAEQYRRWRRLAEPRLRAQ